MSIHVIGLCRPEHKDTKEIGARDEGYQQSKSKDTWILLQALREHWVLRKSGFIDDEGNDEDEPGDHCAQHVCRVPVVLRLNMSLVFYFRCLDAGLTW
jgi:hypothetical protein